MNANTITNPILRGFHPDPSIVRVGEDYYIATSTFEWFPGVQISHSRDFIHWETLGGTLNDPAILDLKGVGPSQGVWAPCLTWDQGTFYLVFTIVRSFYCNMYDTHNYLVTSKQIMGPWSAPVPLNDFGFDPSLFHDTDGRKYMVSMVTDHRIPQKYAGRIILQEYSPSEQRMVGPVKEIYQGDKIFLEGPHIFKRNGWYYLFTADTGTGELHGQTILRSRSVWGPYEMYQSPVMERTGDNEAFSIFTTRHHEDYPLQKAGHADLVETQNGEWYAVHLCGRPLSNRNEADRRRFPGCRRYPLGRETAVQKMRWTVDDWLVLDNGTTLPDTKVPAPELPPCPCPEIPASDDFDLPNLAPVWQSLRVPMKHTHISLTARPGWLRMYGREGLASRFAQTLIARRWTEFTFEASARMEFHPKVFKQMAGLICMYDTDNYFYLHLTFDEDSGTCLILLRAENRSYSYPAGILPVPADAPLLFKAAVDHDTIRFFYSLSDEQNFVPIGAPMDCSFLSDEACEEGWFTGAMVGICCQDLTGGGVYADFDWFEYRTESFQ